MYTVLEKLCFALSIASPALLLAARMTWRTRFPWWLVLMTTVIISTVLGLALDELGWHAHKEQTEACFEAMGHGLTERGCSVSYHVWTLPWYLKWVSGAVVLAACLPFYGLVVRFSRRRVGRNQHAQQTVAADRREDAAPAEQ
jgi:hypothetical protein